METSVQSIYPWELEVSLLYLRYFLIAGITYLVFYHWGKRSFIRLKIQQKFPDTPSILREILYSVSTLTIYSLSSWLIYQWQQRGGTSIYTNIHEYSYFYFGVSILLMILLHDTYFYWTHRFMHSKLLFKRVHRIHHLSLNPTPFSAFAFHPYEALISLGYIPIIVLFIPCHPFALFIFLGYMSITNVMGHLGYETFPRWFRESRLGRWLNTSTNHNLHHQHFKTHFGLYFTFWDRIMQTIEKNQKQIT